MKGKITVEFSAKEAMALLASDATPASVTKKIVTAFRASNVTPQGAKAAAIAKAPAKKAKTAKAAPAANADEASAH